MGVRMGKSFVGGGGKRRGEERGRVKTKGLGRVRTAGTKYLVKLVGVVEGREGVEYGKWGCTGEGGRVRW